MFGLFSKKWNPDGKHVYVTGGSTGLGLALATLLVERGAHVSIVARDQGKLDKALKILESHRLTPSQKLAAYSFSLSTASESTAALEAVCAPFGGLAPDAVFTCAGTSKPMFFLEMTEEDMKRGMENAYWVQAWTAWAAAKKMAKQKKQGGKLVFISSTLGYMSFLGYASYSPGKHALRALADTLHSELALYQTSVHIFFPPTMYTPGYEEENKTKPKIVLEIESTDEGLTAEAAARALFKGVENNEFHITGDWITALFSASTRGATPRGNWLLEGLYDFVAYIAIPVWRSGVDKKVREHRTEHEEYLASKGFFES